MTRLPGSIDIDDLFAAQAALAAKEGKPKPGPPKQAEGPDPEDMSIWQLLAIWGLLTILIVLKLIEAAFKFTIRTVEALHRAFAKPAKPKPKGRR